ncbi:MAG: hypothetical protein ACTH4U_03955 [Pseudoalteromonas prydzensis]|uniref:hypothetical protein n=1 Tax=Pseudoalteromonas prydzensis TaxID=182141 RepID=UPI003F98F1C4
MTPLMLDLTQLPHSSLLANIRSPYGLLRIVENGQYRWFTLGDDHVIQGVMDKTQPDLLCAPVNQAMFICLLPITANTQLLNLGAGSGCFERALKESAIKLTSVEISADIIAAALKYFLLDETTPIINDCAEHFIAQCQQRFDVILIDIFSAQSQQALLQKHAFWHACFTHLTPRGKIAINLAPSNEQQVINLLLLLRSLFNEFIVIEFKQFKNIVVIASNASLAGITIENIKLCDNINTTNLAENIKQLLYTKN